MYHLVRVGFKGGKPSAFMFVDDETHKKGVIPVEKIKEFVSRGETRNIGFENGKVETNGKLSRYYYGRIKGEVKQPIVIMRKFVDKGKTIGFEVFKEPNSAIIKVSPANLLKALSNPSNVLANGRVVKQDGKVFISAIKGNFDTYDYNKIATVDDKRRLKKKVEAVEKDGVSIVDCYKNSRQYSTVGSAESWMSDYFGVYSNFNPDEIKMAKSKGYGGIEAIKWAKKHLGEYEADYVKEHPYTKYEGIRYGYVSTVYGDKIYDYKGREYVEVITHKCQAGFFRSGLATHNGDILIPGLFMVGDNASFSAFVVTKFDRNIVKVTLALKLGEGLLCGFISLRTGKMTKIAYRNSDADKDLGTPQWFNEFTKKPEDIREALSKSKDRISDLKQFIPKHSKGIEASEKGLSVKYVIENDHRYTTGFDFKGWIKVTYEDWLGGEEPPEYSERELENGPYRKLEGVTYGSPGRYDRGFTDSYGKKYIILATHGYERDIKKKYYGLYTIEGQMIFPPIITGETEHIPQNVTFHTDIVELPIYVKGEVLSAFLNIRNGKVSKVAYESAYYNKRDNPNVKNKYTGEVENIIEVLEKSSENAKDLRKYIPKCCRV